VQIVGFAFLFFQFYSYGIFCAVFIFLCGVFDLSGWRIGEGA